MYHTCSLYWSHDCVINKADTVLEDIFVSMHCVFTIKILQAYNQYWGLIELEHHSYWDIECSQGIKWQFGVVLQWANGTALYKDVMVLWDVNSWSNDNRWKVMCYSKRKTNNIVRSHVHNFVKFHTDMNSRLYFKVLVHIGIPWLHINSKTHWHTVGHFLALFITNAYPSLTEH